MATQNLYMGFVIVDIKVGRPMGGYESGVFYEVIAEAGRGLMLQFNKVLLYAVHALYHIGYEVTDRPVMAREISERYSFSYDATLRVLQSLSRNGILVSHRGATGGFTLCRKVESVNLLDIVEALEGRFQTVDPLPVEMGDARLKRSTGLTVKRANRCFTKQLREISIVSLFNQGRHDQTD